MIKHPHWPKPLGYKPIDLGLERIKQLIKNLAVTEENLPPIVHIAGTNGKGSTIAFLRAILEDAGYQVHAYTSPHLVNFNERIVIAGEEISDEYLYDILEETRTAATNIPLTFFEATTGAALLAFAKNKADIVLLETGMGGRLDATNVFTRPLLTIITPISLDHQQFLGNTVSQITEEKAAIIKPNVKCVVSKQLKEAIDVIEQVASEKNASLLKYGSDFGKELLGKIKPNLPGSHQLINAATAIAAAKNLDEFNIPEENIKNGITNAKWQARLQKITDGALCQRIKTGFEIYIDGGHNASAGVTLASWAKRQNKPLYLITGMLENKDHESFLEKFKDAAIASYGVTIPDETTSLSADEITKKAMSIGLNCHAAPNIETAISNICSSSNNTPGIILICGSLYLAGAALEQNQKL